MTWYRPVELESFIELKKQFPGGRLVSDTAQTCFSSCASHVVGGMLVEICEKPLFLSADAHRCC